MESKILLFIVEGRSDEEALGPALTNIVSQSVKFKVMHCDIIGDLDSSPTNIERRIKEFGVKQFLNDNPEFSHNDICGIVHITDTDGVFIPDNQVLCNPDVSGVEYFDDHIEVNPDKHDIILQARENRRQILKHLVNINRIAIPYGKIVPYEIYYMSCNLDYVIDDKRNATKNEKMDLSLDFADNYDDPKKFYEFFNDPSLRTVDNYIGSWDYIESGLNSLKKKSNLNVFLKKYISNIL